MCRDCACVCTRTDKSLALTRPVLFFSNATPTTEISTLSLHDALPISPRGEAQARARRQSPARAASPDSPDYMRALDEITWRSEEHTSELQSHHDLVCRLLLEKKKIASHKTSTSSTTISFASTTSL